MANTTTGTLPGPIKAYYDKRFLVKAKFSFVYKQFGQAGQVPKNEGATVVWNRMTLPTAKTTALTEATDPTPTGLSATLVSANVSEYGNYERISSKVSMTAIDQTIKEAIDTLAYEAAFSIDTIIRDVVCAGGTALYASAVTARNSLTPTDVVQVCDLRKAKRTLTKMGTQPVNAGRFVGIAHPDVIFDLEGDTNWVNAHIYTDKGIDNLYNGEAGELYKMRFVEAPNAPVLTNSGSAGTEVYQTMLVGLGAYGVSDLLNLTTYLDNPSPRSALRMFADLGWKCAFATSVLNDSFMVRLESGASA